MICDLPTNKLMSFSAFILVISYIFYTVTYFTFKNNIISEYFMGISVVKTMSISKLLIHFGVLAYILGLIAFLINTIVYK